MFYLGAEQMGPKRDIIRETPVLSQRQEYQGSGGIYDGWGKVGQEGVAGRVTALQRDFLGT